MEFRAKQKSVTRLEERLCALFRDEQIFPATDAARSSVMDYISRFAPSVTEEDLADRLELRLKQELERMPVPEIADSVRHSVMSSVRMIAARKNEEIDTDLASSFAEALNRLARFAAPCAICLALYVWSVGVIPEYPVGSLYDAGSEYATSDAGHR